jgi:hypothetical protein
MNEENKICNQYINDIYGAFDCFKERFLKEKKSLFSNNEIFTKENLNKITQNFVNNLDESDDSFDNKIKKQLGDKQEVHELFAHIIWLWSLVASDMRQSSKKNDINKWLSEINKIKENNQFSFDHGIMSTGQYHKTNKPAELIYIIKFLEKVLELSNETTYIEIIQNGVMDNIEKQEIKIGNSTKKVAMYNILLHLLDPNYYSSIASYNHKEKIVNFFGTHFNIIFDIDDLDEKFKIVWDKCKKEYENNYPYNWNKTYKDKDFNKLDFYNKDLAYLWKSDIVLEAKNIVLHGAPGTGKTYSVERSIKNRLEFDKDQDSNKQFKLVQFHPSYGYEDFIDGIKPNGISKEGAMQFELKNGEFKKMCIDAFRELKDAKEKNRKPKSFYFVADEINRAELSRVFGELLLCIEDDKRLRFEDKKLIGTKLKTQNSNMWNKIDVVLFIDKNGKVLDDSDYQENWYFGIPENIYFIGTMNDIDRSVDSFDMALRRRFLWKHYKCDYDVIYEHLSDKESIDEYIIICKKLNKYIVSKNGFNLGDSYELGQSYFMKLSNINNTQINKVWIENIAPLLKEYLRTEFSENDIKKELDKAKKLFTLPIKIKINDNNS